MIRTSLTRRLVAGAAGLMIGAAGALALAAPAQAFGNGDGYTHFFSQVRFEPHCDNITVVIQRGTIENDREWTVTVDDEVYWSGVLDPKEKKAFGVDPASEMIEVTFEGAPEFGKFAYPRSPKFDLPLDCPDPDPDPDPTPTPDPDPEPEPEPLKITDTVFFGCDLFAFGIRNDGEEGGVSLTLTPNEEVENGHAPALIPHLGVDTSEFEVPEDYALEGDLDPLGAGEAFPIGPIATDDDPPAHVHGFVPSESLVVTAVVEVDGEVVGEEDISWTALLEAEGIECDEDDGGEGGELPQTGLSTGMIAIGALALLAVGGGLFLVARRRRVTFTA